MASIKKIQLFRNSGGVYMDKASFKELKNSVLGSDNGATTISTLGLQDGEPLVFRYGKGDVSSALAIAHTKYEGSQKNWLELFAPSDETTYSGGNGITIVNGSISLTGQSGTGDKLARVEDGKIYYTDTNSIAIVKATSGNVTSVSPSTSQNTTTYTITTDTDLSKYSNAKSGFLTAHQKLNNLTLTIDGSPQTYNPDTATNISFSTKYTSGKGITVDDNGRTISLKNTQDSTPSGYSTAIVNNGIIYYKDTDTTYLPFDGTKDGLVPKPGLNIKGFLNQDGDWEKIETSDTKYTITEITSPTDTTSAKEYKLCVSGTTVAVGDIIKIPKYSELESAKVRDEGGKQYIDFVYILADGTRNTITVDVSTFITMNEFENGLELSGQKVKARLGKGLKFDSTKTATKLPIMLNIGGSTPSNIGKGADTTGNMDSMLSVDDNGLHISNVIECGTF